MDSWMMDWGESGPPLPQPLQYMQYIMVPEMSDISDDDNQSKKIVSSDTSEDYKDSVKNPSISNTSDDEIPAKKMKLCDSSESSSHVKDPRVGNELDDENRATEYRVFYKYSESCSYENQVEQDGLVFDFEKIIDKEFWASDLFDATNDANQSNKREITFCRDCIESQTTGSINVPTRESAKSILLYINSLLDEVCGSAVNKQLRGVEEKFKILSKVNWTRFNSFIEECNGRREVKPIYNVKDLEIQSIPHEVQLKCVRTRKFKCITHNKIGRIIDLVPITEDSSKLLQILDTSNELTDQESLNIQKISYFFPKLLAKIALESISDSSIKESLQCQHSIFILCCKAKLAFNLNNIDASALFKLTAIEVERDNLNQAFIYYKHAAMSLSSMIFQDNVFPFLSLSELTEDLELLENYERFFLISQIKTAIMNEDIFSYVFDEGNCTELSEAEIDETEAKKSIDYFSVKDLEKYATMFQSL